MNSAIIKKLLTSSMLIIIVTFFCYCNKSSEYSEKKSKKFAYILGFNDYNSLYNDLSDLQYCVKDAEDLNTIFLNNGYKTELKTSNSSLIGLENIIKDITDITEKAMDNDSIVLFFSGHGYMGNDNENYLILPDSKLDNMKESAIPLSNIIGLFEKSKAKNKIIIIDACRAEYVTDKGPFRKSFRNVFNAEGATAIIFSTTPGSTSSEPTRLKEYYDNDNCKIENGFFSHFLIRGLRSGVNESRHIYLLDLFNFIEYGMQQYSLKGGINQKPAIYYNGDNVSIAEKDAEEKSLYKCVIPSDSNKVYEGIYCGTTVIKDFMFVTWGDNDPAKNPIIVPRNGKTVLERDILCRTKIVNFKFYGAHYADDPGAGFLRITVHDINDTIIGEKEIAINNNMNKPENIKVNKYLKEYKGSIDLKKYRDALKIKVFIHSGNWGVIVNNLTLTLK